ncbi:MAG: hypothetical protein M3022_06790, partial [Actinomycetota bacterium]|nr:hypothetical protein [Actinomycetota bacterium]
MTVLGSRPGPVLRSSFRGQLLAVLVAGGAIRALLIAVHPGQGRAAEQQHRPGEVPRERGPGAEKEPAAGTHRGPGWGTAAVDAAIWRGLATSSRKLSSASMRWGQEYATAVL